MTLNCTRCGTEFDTDRDEKYRGQNLYRCPSCGEKHEGRDETALAEPVDSTGGPKVDDLDMEGLAEAGGDVHIHLHQH
jgi:DNA-directed RNA polymerase subunit RPC12/RpoP